jgi:hypothetical protein
VPPRAPAPTVVPAAPGDIGPRSAHPAPATHANQQARQQGNQQARQQAVVRPQESWNSAAATKLERGDTLPARDHDTAVPADTEPPPPAQVPGPHPAPQAAQHAASTAPGGSWLDFPVAPTTTRELEEIPEENDELDEFRPRPAWRQIVDMIRGDAWSMLMVGGAVILVLLLVLIMLLKG